jgi:Fe-S oxidoreductase
MAAADAVPAVLRHKPIALEGVDHRLLHDEQIKRLNSKARQDLPAGQGFLMVQFGGDSHAEVDAAAHRLLDALRESEHDPNVAVLEDPTVEDELWQVREAGLGATAHVPGHRDSFEGWEDSAVAPDRLGAYLRDLEKLYEEFGYADDTAPSLYGHFGQGCVHTRIPFDLYSADGVATYRRFMERAADLVATHGGSFSGEHGDGQSRGELLPRMFGEEIVQAFGELKAIFDPLNRMNPGKVVDPYRLDENLRLGGRWSPRELGPFHFAFPDDGGSFADAANRCVGVGKCRQHEHPNGAVMCPSYQVTREEEHSTRGRARLLFEMLNGHGDGPLDDGWRSTAVLEALDLCLACKGCKTDCPANVDMATYKAEFLAHHYAGRLRPRSHYALGWLPFMATAVGRSRTASVINAITHAPLLPRMLTRMGGVEQREIPLFAKESLQRWATQRGSSPPGTRGRVLLWPDTFTNYFHPHIGQSAVQVLEEAGWQVEIPTEPLCCGLTWISTGQLAIAKRMLRRTSAHLAEHVRSGGLVVGLEPSCAAVFRSDAPELLPEDHDIARLREQTVTLSELLLDHTPGWTPRPVRGDVRALAQVHCHQHAITGWGKDQELLAAAGVSVERLNSGCCGLAGNFGFERGHLDVSKACAEEVLLPAVRSADPSTVIFADGFSCRTQIHELSDRDGVHLAELLAGILDSDSDTSPDLTTAPRPTEPAPWARIMATAAPAVIGLSIGSWLVRTLLRARRP